MDAAAHRPAETQGREPVNGHQTLEPELKAGEGKLPVPRVAPPLPVAEAYELWAPIYDQTPNPLLAREERYLLPLLLESQYERILDLACGTGRWLEKLTAQSAGPGVGIDSSLAMLHVAARKHEIKRKLARAACEILPFRDAVFDLAICSFALGHVWDLDSTVKELARVTKPEADVFVSDLHPEAIARGWRTGFRDGSTAIQIEMLPRSTEETVQAFCFSGFECLSRAALDLGGPEKPIFSRAGKGDAFAEACQFPAVLVCHFRRLGSLAETGRAW
jgi:ubiquinone/menaquinone biosynthesis C-methylase UbiE